MVQPFEELSHDHRELNELLMAVLEALARIERGDSKLEDELHEISDGMEALRDALLEHFGREQEGLFPFVVTHLPHTHARVDAIVVEHDKIAASLTSLVSGADNPTEPWRTQLERFSEMYGEHARTELAFLREVAGALDADAVKRLAQLLDEI